MADVKENDLPKIASYSDIKEVRLVKTDGTSTGMAIDTFINQIAEKVARVDGFASVVAELMPFVGYNGVITSGDCNSFQDSGFSYISGTGDNITNGPEYNMYGLLIVFASHAATFQICSLSTLTAYYRIRWSTDWTDWTRL